MSIKKSMIFVVVCLCIFAAVGCEKESLGNTEHRPLFNAESTYFEKFDSKIEGNKCLANCQVKCNDLQKNTSNGVFQPKHFLGRIFNLLITADMSSSVN